MARVPKEDEDKALVEGWLPDDYFNPKNDEKSHWYQARQTRICLSKFLDSKSNKKTRKKCRNILTKVIRAKDVDMDILNSIFDKYIKYRNFKPWKLEPLIELEVDRKFFIIYYSPSEGGSWHDPIAFTYMRDVGINSVFSTQFALGLRKP